MKPAFLKKNTRGGAAGLSWEAGEVKAINPALAELLVQLSPEDYEVVQEGEYTPDPPAHNSPGFEMPVLTATGEGIEATHPTTSNVEVPVKNQEPVTPVKAPKARATTKKSNKTETPSAE